MTKKAQLMARLGLDSKGFHRGMRSATMAAKRFGKALAAKTFNIAKAGFKGLTVAVTGFAVAMVAGVKSALDFGGRMSDVAEQTKISVKEIMIWEEAMRQGGAEGGKFGDLVSKMQKNIADAGDGLMEKKRSLDVLKLSYQQLERLSPGEQFQLIAERLRQTESPMHRAQAALNLLGRSGAKMFATFGDTGARGKAIQTLGSQIEIFSRQAQAFDRMSDIIGGIKVKLRGFFAGFADKISGPLSIILERFDKMDFAKHGAALAEKLKPWLSKERWGELALELGDQLKIVGDKFIELLKVGMVKVAGLMLDMLKGKGITLGGDKIAKPGAHLGGNLRRIGQGALEAGIDVQLAHDAGVAAAAKLLGKKRLDEMKGAMIPVLGVLGNIKDRAGVLGGKLKSEGTAAKFLGNMGKQIAAGIGSGVAETFKGGTGPRPGERVSDYFARTAKASPFDTKLTAGVWDKPLDVFSDQLAKRQRNVDVRKKKGTPEKSLTVLEQIAKLIKGQGDALQENLGALN